MGNERKFAIKKLSEKCAKKYGFTQNIPFNCKDRGNNDENSKEMSMCYNKNNTNLEKYCGVSWTFYYWKSASIPSFKIAVNKIIENSKIHPSIDKIGWFGNTKSPKIDVIESKTRPLLKEIEDKHPELFDIMDIRPKNSIINQKCKNFPIFFLKF